MEVWFYALQCKISHSANYSCVIACRGMLSEVNPGRKYGNTAIQTNVSNCGNTTAHIKILLDTWVTHYLMIHNHQKNPKEPQYVKSDRGIFISV